MIYDLFVDVFFFTTEFTEFFRSFFVDVSKKTLSDFSSADYADFADNSDFFKYNM